MSKLLLEPFLLLFRDWNLTRELFRRTLVQRFVVTRLGWWWLLLNPLLLIGIYLFMFTVVISTKREGESQAQHAIAIAQCLMVYHFFADSTASASTSLVRQSGLVKRQSIPIALLPVLELFPSLVQFVLCTLLIASAGLIMKVNFELSYFGILILFIPTILLAAGVSWALGACTVFFRDLEALYGHATRILLYTSGVFWGLAQLPPVLRPVFFAHPLMQLSELTRAFMFGTDWRWWQLAYLYGASIIVFYSGYLVFNRLRRGLIDHL